MTAVSRLSPPRIDAIDLARSIALIGMAVFHFTFDLQFFGLVPPGTSTTGFFWYFARAVAGSFLFLAGLSLWLAHGGGIRWRSFWRRWFMVAGAALLVSLGTRVAMGEAWVFFGILHAIALFSLLGLACLRLPGLLLLVLAAAILAGAQVLPDLLQWNAAPLRFLGLGTIAPFTVDFEPVFPWFGVFLAGIGAAKLAMPALTQLAGWRIAHWLTWPGRHSLMIYLLHQPVLIGLLWLGLQLI